MSKPGREEKAARQAMEGYQRLTDVSRTLYWVHRAIRETGSPVECVGIVEGGMIHTRIQRPGDMLREGYIRPQDVSCWQDCARLLLFTPLDGITEDSPE